MEADPNGPEGINPAIVAKVLRWAAAVVLKETNPETDELAETWDDDDVPAIDEVFSDLLDRLAAQQEGRAAYLAARETVCGLIPDGKVTP